MNIARMTTQDLRYAYSEIERRNRWGVTESSILREMEAVREELSGLRRELDRLEYRDGDAVLRQSIADELNRREAAQKYNLNIFEGWRTETEQ